MRNFMVCSLVIDFWLNVICLTIFQHIHHWKTTATSIEKRFTLRSNHPASGWRQTECPHEPANRQSQHHQVGDWSIDWLLDWRVTSLQTYVPHFLDRGTCSLTVVAVCHVEFCCDIFKEYHIVPNKCAGHIGRKQVLRLIQFRWNLHPKLLTYVAEIWLGSVGCFLRYGRWNSNFRVWGQLYLSRCIFSALHQSWQMCNSPWEHVVAQVRL